MSMDVLPRVDVSLEKIEWREDLRVIDTAGYRDYRELALITLSLACSNRIICGMCSMVYEDDETDRFFKLFKYPVGNDIFELGQYLQLHWSVKTKPMPGYWSSKLEAKIGHSSFFEIDTSIKCPGCPHIAKLRIRIFP